MQLRRIEGDLWEIPREGRGSPAPRWRSCASCSTGSPPWARSRRRSRCSPPTIGDLALARLEKERDGWVAQVLLDLGSGGTDASLSCPDEELHAHNQQAEYEDAPPQDAAIMTRGEVEPRSRRE